MLVGKVQKLGVGPTTFSIVALTTPVASFAINGAFPAFWIGLAQDISIFLVRTREPKFLGLFFWRGNFLVLVPPFVLFSGGLFIRVEVLLPARVVGSEYRPFSLILGLPSLPFIRAHELTVDPDGCVHHLGPGVLNRIHMKLSLQLAKDLIKFCRT